MYVDCCIYNSPLFSSHITVAIYRWLSLLRQNFIKNIVFPKSALTNTFCFPVLVFAIQIYPNISGRQGHGHSPSLNLYSFERSLYKKFCMCIKFEIYTTGTYSFLDIKGNDKISKDIFLILREMTKSWQTFFSILREMTKSWQTIFSILREMTKSWQTIFSILRKS